MISMQRKFIINFIFIFCIFLFLFLTTKFEILEGAHAFVPYFILVINSVLFLEIKEFLSREENIKDSFYKLLNVSLTGLSNIGLFAYIYYKAGVEGPAGVIVG